MPQLLRDIVRVGGFRRVAVFAGVPLLLTEVNAMAIEEPAYQLVKSYAEFELRRNEVMVEVEGFE